jgi:hypothetical protein
VWADPCPAAAAEDSEPSDWDMGFIVEDCRILGTGKEYTGASGLFAGYVGNSTFQHNLFLNQTYTAITIGWGCKIHVDLMSTHTLR